MIPPQVTDTPVCTDAYKVYAQVAKFRDRSTFEYYSKWVSKFVPNSTNLGAEIEPCNNRGGGVILGKSQP